MEICECNVAQMFWAIILKMRQASGGSLDLAFGGRTEQRNYIEMGLSTPGGALSIIAAFS